MISHIGNISFASGVRSTVTLPYLSFGAPMERKIFIAATEQRSGKSLLTIGLLRALQGFVPHVGYMKPIGQRYSDGGDIDLDARLIRDIFDLSNKLSDINPATMKDAQGEKDVFFDAIFSAYGRISTGKDIVVIEGTDYTSSLSALEFDINAELAKNLVAPVLLVANGHKRDSEVITANLIEVAESFTSMGCDILGAVINRFEGDTPAETCESIRTVLAKRDLRLYGAIPTDPLLGGPRLKDVADQLQASIFFKGDDLSKVVTGTKILAMSPENALGHIRDEDGCLLICPGDRMDSILTALYAQESTLYPKYSGLILTGGLLPGPNMRDLLKGVKNSEMTILSVHEDTFAATLKVNAVSGEITKDDSEKIDRANALVEKHLDIDELYSHLGTIESKTVTPRMFQYRLMQMAKSSGKHVVLPEGTEPRILRAAAEVLNKEMCEITLLGNTGEMNATADRLGISIESAHLLDPAFVDEELRDAYAQIFYDLRKHKGVSLEMARDLMLDPVHYATMMVHQGDADGFVSGSTHSTADTLGPVLRVIKTRAGTKLASSIFFMLMPDRVIVYGDCALVENPTAEQLAEIAVTSADTAKAFGVEPYVAMLSYSTGRSGQGADVDKVRRGAELAREMRPDLAIEGPIQYDAAVSADVARIKIKDSKVAGKASVFIFPDLDAGNTAYKAVQRSANVPAIGPVMQGLRKPANDLSRGASVVDIVYTIAITAIQSQQDDSSRA